MKDLVKKFDAFSVWRIIGKTELKKLSSLVINVNYKHFCGLALKIYTSLTETRSDSQIKTGRITSIPILVK